MAPAEAPPETAQVMIINPRSGGGVAGMFSTHPPIEKRVALTFTDTRRLSSGSAPAVRCCPVVFGYACRGLAVSRETRRCARVAAFHQVCNSAVKTKTSLPRRPVVGRCLEGIRGIWQRASAAPLPPKDRCCRTRFGEPALQAVGRASRPSRHAGSALSGAAPRIFDIALNAAFVTAPLGIVAAAPRAATRSALPHQRHRSAGRSSYRSSRSMLRKTRRGPGERLGAGDPALVLAVAAARRIVQLLLGNKGAEAMFGGIPGDRR